MTAVRPERVRNATHLRRLMARREVRLQFEAAGARFGVRLTTAEAEWLRRQTAATGRELVADVRGDGPEFLHLSVRAPEAV